MGSKAKKLFIVFAYLTLILVVAAFGSIVANTFKAAYTESGALLVFIDGCKLRRYRSIFSYLEKCLQQNFLLRI